MKPFPFIQHNLWTDPVSFIFIWCSVHVIQATDPFTQCAFANRIDAVRTVHNTNCRLLPIGWAGRWAGLICPEWAENSGCLKSVMIFLVHRCTGEGKKESMSVFSRSWAKPVLIICTLLSVSPFSLIHLRGWFSHLDLGGGYMEIC